MRVPPIWATAMVAAGLTAPVMRSQEQKPPALPNPGKMDVLKQLSTSFEEVSQRCGRAVVQIYVRSYVPADNPSSSGELLTAQDSTGSGILLTPDGYILTNAHVVKGAHTVRVQLNMRMAAQTSEAGHQLKRALVGSIIGIDRESDLAVIKVRASNYPYLTFGDSDAIKQGQVVLALGNPLGLDNSVSMGVVSAVSRQIKPDDPMAYIQTDAPINPGNSGGPLVDTDGHVLGINTLILSQSGGSEGIGLAVPATIASQVYEQLKAKGHVHHAQMGLVAQTVTEDMADGLKLETNHGVIVSDLEPNGPAAHGGLQVDDVITGLNGRPINTLHQLQARVFRLTPKAQLRLQVQRGNQQVDVPVITEEQSGGELDALADMVDPVKNVVAPLGIVGLDITKPVHDLLPDLRRPAGVVVAARRQSAPFSGAVLSVGDVLYAENRQVVNGVEQLKQVLGTLKSGDAAVLLVEREKRLIYVSLQLE